MNSDCNDPKVRFVNPKPGVRIRASAYTIDPLNEGTLVCLTIVPEREEKAKPDNTHPMESRLVLILNNKCAVTSCTLLVPVGVHHRRSRSIP